MPFPRCSPVDLTALVKSDATDESHVVERVTQESLLTSGHLHRALLASSMDCVKVLDLQGRLVWMNEHGQQLMDVCEIHSALGSNWVDFWSEPYREAAVEAVLAARENQVRRFTGPCATASGTWKWWDVAVTPIADRTGRVEYLLAVSRDVTEYMALCRERDDLLEQERRLRLDLEKTNRKRDYALLAAAHELGAPLYAVRGWTQFLQMGNGTACDWSDGIEAIEGNTRRLHDMIQRVLEVARFRCGQMTLQRVLNSVADVVAEAIRDVDAAARAKQIAISTDLAHDAWVYADFEQLRRAFTNILFNAVKFTPAGGTIRVRSTVEHQSVVTEVLDDGVGIAPEFLNEIFEPFSQCAMRAGESNAGMGLGLSIVRRIVEAHEGMVRASSAGDDLGARFTVTLPLVIRRTER